MVADLTLHQTEIQLSLPEWIESHLALVSGPNRNTPLPINLTLSQQNILKQQISLRSYLLQAEPDPKKMIVQAAEFIRATFNQNLTETQVEAKGMAFAVALADLPAWAIQESIHRWHRGEIPFPVNFGFPVPAELRKVVLYVLQLEEGKKIALERLLAASEEMKFTESHQKTMMEKLKDIFKGFSREEFKKRIEPCETNIPPSK